LPGGEGLSYYNARWYDPKLGRFLSADTIVPGPANPQAFNRYSYVFNNPVRLVDPSGHMPMFSQGNGAESSTGKPVNQPKAPTPIFTGLNFSVPNGNYNPNYGSYKPENAIYMNHFGANNFAKEYATAYYRYTSGLHGSTDFMLPSGTQIYSRTTGTVVGIDTGDANPNVVVRVNSPDMGIVNVVYGHITADQNLKLGSTVTSDSLIGTVWSNPSGDHLHLTVYQDNKDGSKTAYNPLYLFPATTFDYDSHIATQSYYGELATNQVMWKFNYSSSSFWNGDDVGAVDVNGNRVEPPK
jgi:RHS repeat-associated protein